MFTPNKKRSRTPVLAASLPLTYPTACVFRASAHTPADSLKLNKQNVAKDQLLEVDSVELAALAERGHRVAPFSINRWVQNESKPPNREAQTYKQYSNVWSIGNRRPAAHMCSSSRASTKQNTVHRLKQALKKLESPEKSKGNRKKSEVQVRAEMYESLLSRRKNPTKVSDLIKLRQCDQLKRPSIVVRKVSTSMGERAQRVDCNWDHSDPLEAKRKSELFNFNFQEGRRNKTLKVLLE